MAPQLLTPRRASLDHDQYVALAGATWADYQRTLEVRGEKATPRITYLEGVLELMRPPDGTSASSP